MKLFASFSAAPSVFIDIYLLTIFTSQTENLSIIYGYDGTTFQRDFINHINGNRYLGQVLFHLGGNKLLFIGTHLTSLMNLQ